MLKKNFIIFISVYLSLNLLPIVPCKTFAGNGPLITDNMMSWTLCYNNFPFGMLFQKTGVTVDYLGVFRVSGCIENMNFWYIGNALSQLLVAIIALCITILIIKYNHEK